MTKTMPEWPNPPFWGAFDHASHAQLRSCNYYAPLGAHAKH